MTEMNAASLDAQETPTWSVEADNGNASLLFHMNGMAITHETGTDPMYNGYTVTEDSSGGEREKCEDEDKQGKKERWIWVLDPMTRKLRVPLSQLVPTQATATTGTVPSLCISFLEGRCRHQWCRQAHVLPSAIPQLRYEALHAPTCCRVHDDPHDTSVLVSRFKYIRIVSGGTHSSSGTSAISGGGGAEGADGCCGELSDLIPSDRVAQTVGLLRFMAHSAGAGAQRHRGGPARVGGRRQAEAAAAEAREEEALELPAKLVCRLHLAHRCRYLEDCNNIHICREYETRLQPPPQVVASLASVGPATRSVTIADTCYATQPLAVGEVTDEQFRALCEQQRATNSATQTQTHVAAAVAAAAHVTRSATAVRAGSPMLYGNSSLSSCPASGTSPLTLGAAAESASGLLFPAQPETDTLAQQSQQSQQSRVLRIYDVRPRAASANSPAVTQSGGKSHRGHTRHNTPAGGTPIHTSAQQ